MTQGRNPQANLEDTREDLRENRTAVDTVDRVGRAVESDTHRQSHDGESLVLRRKMPTDEDVEDNLSQRRMEKLEGRGLLGMWWNSRKRKRALAARGSDTSTGQMKILTMRREKAPTAWSADPSTGHMKINANEPCKIRKGRREWFTKIREDRCDGLGQTRQDRDDGFVRWDECVSEQQVWRF